MHSRVECSQDWLEKRVEVDTPVLNMELQVAKACGHTCEDPAVGGED